MRKTQRHLSDGREIIYFDPDGAPAREAIDRRGLEAPVISSQIRHDPLLDEWVAVAGHRQSRTLLPPTDECPLCPTREGHLSEVPEADYEVVVFQNRFPSLATTAIEPGVTGDELYPVRAGRGRCEVVCFTSDHHSALGELAPARLRLVMDAWVDRTRELGALPEVAQVFCFENRGLEIGVTLSHPHGQIYGYPFVPPRTRTMLASAARHRERTGRNLFEDILAHEVREQIRIVARTAYWTAFVPAAARWPVEVHLYPNRPVADLTGLTEAEKDDFAEVYRDLLRRGDAYFGVPLPYIAAWHQAPVGEEPGEFRVHLQLFSVRRGVDRLKFLAGSESAMGVWIGDVAPEAIAQRLREVGDTAVR